MLLRRLLPSVLAAALLLPAVADYAQAQVRPPERTPRPRPRSQGDGAAAEPPAAGGNDKQLSDAQRKRGRFHMDFDKVDIVEVIKYISQWTNKNFILPDNVRGKITIIGPTDVSADEAYAAFLASLETNNLTVTPTGKFLKIVPKKESTRTNIPTCLGTEDCRLPLDERMVTKMFRLRYVEADPIKNVVQQFVTREGEIVPFPPDILIVSDNSMNVLRVERILEQLDQPGAQDEINVLQVEHASVQDMSNMLTQIFQQQQAGGAPGARRPSIAAALPKDGRAAPNVPGQPAAAGAGTAEAGSANISKIIPDERTNKLIVVASARSFLRVKELVRKLDVPTDTGQVHVHYLENADAEEIASTLQALASGTSSGATTRRRAGAATPGAPPTPAPAGGAAGAASAALFSGEVKVTADKSTNSLLVIASPADYRNLRKVIERLDIRRRQVFIEAVIMEVKLNGENRLNVDLHTGYAFEDVQLPGTDKGTVPLVIGSENSAPGASLNLASLASLNGFLAGIQGPPVKVAGIPISLPSFGVILNALQKNSDVNVISTPHILTSDNEEAEISVGSNVPFQAAYAPNLGGLGGLGTTTGTTTGTTASSSAAALLGGLGGLGGLSSFYAPIQRQPVELRLKLKPQINESDYIRLEIDEQVEEISSVDRQLGPTTAKRSVKTTVVARDQSTVVIGGLIQERTTRADTKVPLLGSLPVIGALFRASSTVREKTNLLLFLTPYVIRDQSDFRRIFERKMRERQEFVARFFGTDEHWSAHVDWERKRGPLATVREAVHEEASKVENGGAGAPGERLISPEQPDETPVPVPPGTQMAPPPPANGLPPPGLPQGVPAEPAPETLPAPGTPLPEAAPPPEPAPEPAPEPE